MAAYYLPNHWFEDRLKNQQEKSSLWWTIKKISSKNINSITRTLRVCKVELIWCIHVCTHTLIRIHVCTHTYSQTGRNRLFHAYKNKLKKHENTSVSECISLSVLEKASPLRPCLSPPCIFLTSWSPQRSFLGPHAHPLPGCHHLLNLRCPSPEEPLCFYFFSLHKDKHSNGMTQQL